MALAAHGLSSHGIVHPVFRSRATAQASCRGRRRRPGIVDPPRHRPHRQRSRHGRRCRASSPRRSPTCAPPSAIGRRCAARWTIAEELGPRRMPATDETRAEAQEFLRWAADNHFTFLGYREYEVASATASACSSRCRAPGWASCAATKRPQAAPVHRPGRRRPARRRDHRPADPDQDQLALDRAPPRLHGLHRRAGFDEAGNAIAEQRFLGLYTSSAYNRRPVGNPAGAPAPCRRDGGLRPGRDQPQRQGPPAHPGNAAARRAVPVRHRGTHRVPPWASSACRNARARACSCAATATAASIPRWSTSRATASAPMCASASRRC